ncbi:MAG: elongation factor Ts [Candidatus Dormibacteraeota bacterium]|nr:elongation factor Ts [Candidatus Dormibacteraeota bacterium]MBV9524773.1 elongation factor Ts [Candidatus Dormibacteraeota bacterium]
MAEVTAAMVKRLRDETGAGMMDAKRALTETGADFERARDWLRAKGLARAADKAGRETKEGLVEAYVHHSGGIAKQGALVELDCESDFVAKTDDFKHLAHAVALQVVGASPRWVRREEVPAEIVEREKGVYRDQVAGKPDHIVDKILEGKLNDFYSKVCLMEQPWIKDDKKRVGDLVTEAVAKLGENITVARFVRFAVGEAAADGDGASTAT